MEKVKLLIKIILMKKQFLFLLVLISFSIILRAQVVMPGIFTDRMVLQRNTLIPVWGWAQPNEKVEILFHNQVKNQSQ
jgi:sialate O-acetylesterase